MSAMALMPKAVFYAELRKHGFEETHMKTEESTLWCFKETGKHYPIPHYADEVPDSVLEHYLRAVGKLYTEAAKTSCTDKKYYVTETKPELELVKPAPGA